ncbi:MAG: transcription antitermination factor NusB [Prevotellaceae bacterium]|jgi:N utilization substance protein B|nr:transcription antitermination factor NusB [Prevotellaceae bacterium]
MLTRALLRTKAAQVLYANFQADNSAVAMQNELEFSLQKTYDLYFFLLLLPIEITKIAQKSVLIAEKKMLKPKDKDNINALAKLVENKFSQKLSENQVFIEYVERRKLSWLPYVEQLQDIFSTLKKTDFLAEYAMSSENSFKNDKKFWRCFFQSNWIFDKTFEEFLEDLSVYWVDDLEIVRSFVDKTVDFYKQYALDDSKNIFPLYKDDDDRIFIKKIAQRAFERSKEYDKMILPFLRDWELKRLAQIDIVLLKMAIAEIELFFEIPVSITMNEYIEIAKYYGTKNSQVFINGILDKIVKYMRVQGILNKINEISVK